MPPTRARTRRAWLLGAAILTTGAACGGDGGDGVAAHEEPGTGTESTGGEGEGSATIEPTGGEAVGADAGPGASTEPPGGDVVALYGVAPPPED